MSIDCRVTILVVNQHSYKEREVAKVYEEVINRLKTILAYNALALIYAEAKRSPIDLIIE